MKKAFKIILFIFILIIMVGGGVAYYYASSYQKALETPNSDSTEKVQFTIEQGEGIDSITARLVEEGLLNEDYTLYLKVYLKQNNLGSNIQAGSFTIPKDLTMQELVKTLENGEEPTVWISLQEGLRADEFADILDAEFSQYDAHTFNKDEFLQLIEDEEYIETFDLKGNPTSLEGFLFPDKYLFATNATTKDVINKLIDNFKAKVGNNYTYEHLIVASIAEREAITDKDRRMIADIVERRVDEGWLLGMDTTLLYYHKDWKHEITVQDKAIDHPYNTYLTPGLPPTPIGNPGMSSINAAQNPIKNDYYFFIADSNGIVIYAKDIDEHNENINLYLQ